MTRHALTQTQTRILVSAAARKDGAVLPLPDSVKLRGVALKKALAALLELGLIQERKDGVLIVSKAARKAVEAEKTPTAAVQPACTKQASLLALLQRTNGATLGDLMAATSWQAHSVRGFLSGTVRKRMGLMVNSEKDSAGQRRYCIVGGA